MMFRTILGSDHVNSGKNGVIHRNQQTMACQVLVYCKKIWSCLVFIKLYPPYWINIIDTCPPGFSELPPALVCRISHICNSTFGWQLWTFVKSKLKGLFFTAQENHRLKFQVKFVGVYLCHPRNCKMTASSRKSRIFS